MLEKRKILCGFIVLILSVCAQAQVFKEVKEVDQIEAVSSGHCQIRQATKVLKNGKEISKSFHRWSVDPEGDLSQFDKRVQAICTASWTPDVIKKYKEQQKINDLKLKK
jgi:hypothetical protein